MNVGASDFAALKQVANGQPVDPASLDVQNLVSMGLIEGAMLGADRTQTYRITRTGYELLAGGETPATQAAYLKQYTTQQGWW